MPFLNYSCNLAIEYMCEQIESVSVSGIFLYFVVFWHKIQLFLKSWNFTFSCRKTGWTEKVCRGSHTPGAVHSGNLITLLPVSQQCPVSVSQIHHPCFLCSLVPHVTLCMLTAKQSVPWAPLERQSRPGWFSEQGGDKCSVLEFFHSWSHPCFGMKSLCLRELKHEGWNKEDRVWEGFSLSVGEVM